MIRRVSSQEGGGWLDRVTDGSEGWINLQIADVFWTCSWIHYLHSGAKVKMWRWMVMVGV